MKQPHIIMISFFLLAACSSKVKNEETAQAAGQIVERVAQKPAYEATNEGWLVDLDEAYKQARERGVPIMANFTGSDWCGWCKRLTASVFSKPEFKSWADENVVLLELDFPRRTRIPDKYRQQNAGLQQAFKVRGFPTVWVFNLDRDSENGQFQIEALGKTGYARSVAEFTGAVDQMIDR